VLLAGGIAGTSGHADEQPLVLESTQIAGAAVQMGGGQVGQRAQRIDELAMVAPAFGADDVIGEVGGDDGGSADQRHDDHLPAALPDSAAAVVAHRLVGHRQGVYGQRQGLIVAGRV
jgi:hypothetical protein